MQKTKGNDFWRFIKRNLAIILIVSCAIGATLVAVVVKANKNNKIPDDVINVGGMGNSNDLTDGTGITPLPDASKPIPTPEQDPPVVQPKAYVLPVTEYVLGMDYSRDSEYVLVFKKTLNEYSVHNGIDFLADEGSEVRAINDGKVTAVTNDFGMGWTVEITHEDGYVSCYSSLGEDIAVSVGDEVECGQKIGCVANTATYETLEGSHLHFELKKDGEYVNPRAVLPLE